MIYDARVLTLPREGRGVQHARLTDERVTEDTMFFEPQIPAHGGMFLVLGSGVR
jgi:hypothetical protein